MPAGPKVRLIMGHELEEEGIEERRTSSNHDQDQIKISIAKNPDRCEPFLSKATRSSSHHCCEKEIALHKCLQQNHQKDASVSDTIGLPSVGSLSFCEQSIVETWFGILFREDMDANEPRDTAFSVALKRHGHSLSR